MRLLSVYSNANIYIYETDGFAHVTLRIVESELSQLFGISFYFALY